MCFNALRRSIAVARALMCLPDMNDRMGVLEAAATFGVAGGAGPNESAVLALWGGGGGGEWSSGPVEQSKRTPRGAVLSVGNAPRNRRKAS